MAKYIGTYTNSGAVQTALDNHELYRPFVAYTTDNDEVIYGPEIVKAEAGDIVVYATGDTILHYIKQADYNTTSYPVADFVPVGVVAYAQDDNIYSGVTGEITFIGRNFLDKSNPDTGNATRQNIEWGSIIDISGLTNYNQLTAATTDMDGKANTQAVLAYSTGQTNWRTDSAITFTNGEMMFPLFECSWRYHTSGTAQGDWYIPSLGQFYKVVQDEDRLTAVNSGFTMISANGYANDNYGTSTEASNDKAWFGRRDAWSSAGLGKPYSYDWGQKPFCRKLMTRI